MDKKTFLNGMKAAIENDRKTQDFPYAIGAMYKYITNKCGIYMRVTDFAMYVMGPARLAVKYDEPTTSRSVKTKGANQLSEAIYNILEKKIAKVKA